VLFFYLIRCSWLGFLHLIRSCTFASVWFKWFFSRSTSLSFWWRIRVRLGFDLIWRTWLRFFYFSGSPSFTSACFIDFCWWMYEMFSFSRLCYVVFIIDLYKIKIYRNKIYWKLDNLGNKILDLFLNKTLLYNNIFKPTSNCLKKSS